MAAYRFEYWGALRAFFRPYFLLSFSRASRVRRPARFSVGRSSGSRPAIARALVELDGELRGDLKKAGFLTRDDREKESKKYGLKKARKAPQYSKR